MGGMATPRKPRGPYAKTAKRLADITEAALALVIERGHSAVTTADVAERAGLTEATVLYHFPTKDHIFVAVLSRNEANDNDAQVPDITGDDPGPMIGRQAAINVSHANTLRLFVAMAAEACNPTHPAHAWFLKHHGEARRIFADILRQQQDAGLAHPDIEAERFSRQMVAIWDGLQSQWLIDPSFDLAEEVTAAFNTLTRVDTMAARRAMEALAAGL
jgi:AcrR family transcriptional regulator